MNYRIWKASITEYRVQNLETKEVLILSNFVALGCELKVNLKQYYDAKKQCFVNSGNPFDYFAWIEAKEIKPAEADKANKVFYNPFKSPFFRDRESNDIITFSNKITINGNTLSYE